MRTIVKRDAVYALNTCHVGGRPIQFLLAGGSVLRPFPVPGRCSGAAPLFALSLISFENRLSGVIKAASIGQGMAAEIIGVIQAESATGDGRSNEQKRKTSLYPYSKKRSMNVTMTERFLSTGQVARKLGIQRYQLLYLLDTRKVPEPSCWVAGKRAWSQDEIAAVAEVIAEEKAARARGPRRGRPAVKG